MGGLIPTISLMPLDVTLGAELWFRMPFVIPKFLAPATTSLSDFGAFPFHGSADGLGQRNGFAVTEFPADTA